MFKIHSLLLCLLSYFMLQSTADEISFIKPCKMNDGGCLVSNAQAAIPHFAAGFPDIGIPAADPMTVDTININNSNLKLNFKNIKIVGAGKSKVMSLERNTNDEIKINLETPIIVNGQYELLGKILFIEAHGNGDFEFKSDRLDVTVTIKYTTIEKDGVKYWKITKVDYTYEFKEKLHIKLDNLFGGDKTAAESINHVFDVSWKEVVEELGGPIFDKIINEFANIVKKFFLIVPINKLEI